MNEEMGLLIQLQRVDTQLSRFRERELTHKNKIETERVALGEMKSKLLEAQKQLDQITKERREKEKDIEAQELQIQKTQGRLKEIKNNKEYQAHLHEIDALKRARGTLEETVLLLMDKMEILTSEVNTEKNDFKEKEEKFSDSVRLIEEEITKLHEEKTKLEEERNKLSAQVNKKLLGQYEHLLATRKGNALAGVNRNTCLGCYMSLPPQLVAEVKRNEKFLACSQCYRILYWQEIYEPKTA